MVGVGFLTGTPGGTSIALVLGSEMIRPSFTEENAVIDDADMGAKTQKFLDLQRSERLHIGRL